MTKDKAQSVSGLIAVSVGILYNYMMYYWYVGHWHPIIRLMKPFQPLHNLRRDVRDILSSIALTHKDDTLLLVLWVQGQEALHRYKVIEAYYTGVKP